MFPAPASATPLTGLARLLAIGVFAFGGMHLLFSAVPAQAELVGGRHGPGAATAALMFGTVAGQVASPWIRRRSNTRTQMTVASGLLGIPALGYAVASDLTGILVVSAIRGLGFGLLTVSVTAFLIANVPVERRGTATGRFGFASGLAGMIGSPAGVWLWQRSPDMAWVAGGAMAVIAGLISLSPQFADRPTSGTDGSWARPTDTAPVIAGLIGFGCATAAFAAVFSLIPVTVPAIASGVLLAATTAMTVARWAVGSAADRWGFWPFLPVGLVFTAVGLWGLAVGDGVVVYLSAASFGLGFGLMATVSLLAVVAGYGEERLSSASAVWNIVFDSGTALGGLIIAGLAVVMTYDGVFGVFALIHLVGLFGVATLVLRGRSR